jgi:lysylphosphatidylglycerol synthetase-like protein (DUF2156 family)
MSQPPRDFTRFCGGNDWDSAFYQTLPDFLPMYERYGFAKMKLGEDAIVSLRRFTLEKRVAGKGAGALVLAAPRPAIGPVTPQC